MQTVTLTTTTDGLRASLTPRVLGLTPRMIWNPSPSVDHCTQPLALPQKIRIGVQVTPETGAKFSPPPYAFIIEDGDQRMLVTVSAEAGWHRWNDIIVSAAVEQVTVDIDLEGQTSPPEASAHIQLHLISGRPGESRHALLSRGLAMLYPQAYQPAGSIPAWWRRPIYCGGGDQVTTAMYLEGVGPEARGAAYCIQGLYERRLEDLDKAGVPVGTIIIDFGWSLAGVWRPDPIRWPDLRGFIQRQHKCGRHVLLWIALWLWDGLPDELCVFAGDRKLTADPTNPSYLKLVAQWVNELIRPDGCDADGFKIDQLAFCPSFRRPHGGPRFGNTFQADTPTGPIRRHGDGFGVELLYALQKTIYDAAKAAKPDCLINSSTVHPYFYDTLDMVRLHDMGNLTPEIFAAMAARADLARAALPTKLIDTDNWIHTDYQTWLRYTKASRRLGVPCIFYANRFMLNWTAEPATCVVPIEDLRAIARAWEGL